LAGAIKARNIKITTFGIDDIGLGTEKIGLSGSPTIVANVVNIVSERPPVIMSNGHSDAALVENFIANFNNGREDVVVTKEKTEKKAAQVSDLPYYDNRNGAKGILTWAETANGMITRPSIEILTPARKLAEQLGGDTKIMTLLIGNKISGLAQTLIENGSDEVSWLKIPDWRNTWYCLSLLFLLRSLKQEILKLLYLLPQPPDGNWLRVLG
jgi:hypothetical protein